MKSLLFVLVLSSLCHADNLDQTYTESWKIGTKVFVNKAEAIRYIVSSGSQEEVVHTQCQILTNKLSFKACPKNKKASWDTEQFKSITATNGGAQ